MFQALKNQQTKSYHKMQSLHIAPFLLILLINYSSCSFGAATGDGVTLAIVQCLTRNQVMKMQILGLSDMGALNPNAKNSLSGIKLIGITGELQLRTCRYKDATGQVDYMMDAIPADLFDKVWITVHEGSNYCSWYPSPPDQNCSYLKQLIAAIQSRNKNVGIRSDIKAWKNAFGSTSGCMQVGRHPLWYQSLDGVPNFNDFVPFAGFLTPQMKSFKNKSSLCGLTDYTVVYYS